MSVMEAIRKVAGDNDVAPGHMLNDLIARGPADADRGPGSEVRGARQARLG